MLFEAAWDWQPEWLAIISAIVSSSVVVVWLITAYAGAYFEPSVRDGVEEATDAQRRPHGSPDPAGDRPREFRAAATAAAVVAARKRGTIVPTAPAVKATSNSQWASPVALVPVERKKARQAREVGLDF